MVEPSGLSRSSSSPPSGRSSRETFPKILQSLENQGVELWIVLSIQPLSSHLPPSEYRSPYESSLESPDNPIQTLESLQTFNNLQRLVSYPPDPFVISPQHPYSPYDQPSVPLELSPRSSLAHRWLFSMESKGEIPISSLSQSEVSATHTPQVGNEQPYELPLEGFPFTGRVSSLSYP